mgnify:CR=1 FL=1
MLSQVPASADVLPLQLTGDAKYQSATVEDDPAALVAAIVPQYVSGVLYSALCEASASEHGARRTAMNAANEEAVGLFLQDKIGFYDIADAVEAALRLPVVQEPSLADIFEADRLARIHTRERFLK